MPLPISNIEQVDAVKLLHILFPRNFCFDAQVCNVLKLCSQRDYLLKLLCDQLHTVCLALIISRLRYILTAWSVFLLREAAMLVRSWDNSVCLSVRLSLCSL